MVVDGGGNYGPGSNNHTTYLFHKPSTGKSFTSNVTEIARRGDIDPVIGEMMKLGRVIEILYELNNPTLAKNSKYKRLLL